jgi:hypothetical protein
VLAGRVSQTAIVLANGCVDLSWWGDGEGKKGRLAEAAVAAVEGQTAMGLRDSETRPRSEFPAGSFLSLSSWLPSRRISTRHHFI